MSSDILEEIKKGLDLAQEIQNIKDASLLEILEKIKLKFFPTESAMLDLYQYLINQSGGIDIKSITIDKKILPKTFLEKVKFGFNLDGYDVVKSEIITGLANNEENIKKVNRDTFCYNKIIQDLIIQLDNIISNQNINIQNYDSKISEYQEEIEKLKTEADSLRAIIKTKTDANTDLINKHEAVKKSNNLLNEEIKKVHDEKKELISELTELNKSIEAKIQQGVRLKCKVESKEILAKKPKVNSSSKGVISEEIVKKMRQEFKDAQVSGLGVKKVELGIKYGINKSTTLRILNDQSYTDPKYYNIEKSDKVEKDITYIVNKKVYKKRKKH